jgi:hypothetical protein
MLTLAALLSISLYFSGYIKCISVQYHS